MAALFLMEQLKLTVNTPPENAYELTLTSVTIYLDATCPVVERTIQGARSPEFTPDVLRLIRQQKIKFRKSRKIRRGLFNQHLGEITRLTKVIDNKLADNRRKAVTDTLARFRHDPKRFWATVFKLWKGERTPQKMPTMYIPPTNPTTSSLPM